MLNDCVNDSGYLLPSQKICFHTYRKVNKLFGKSSETFLRQLHYWLCSKAKVGKVFEERRWIYNTYEEWANNIETLSVSTIRRTIDKLSKAGIILIANLHKNKANRTNWYTIDYKKLKEATEIIQENKRSDSPKEEVSTTLTLSSCSTQNEQNILISASTTTKDIISINRQAEQVSKGEKNTLAQDLLEIWNQVVEQGKRIILLTKKRAQFLIAAYKLKFSSCLESWRAFCKQITSSKFLMGEIKSTFRASLDWVLGFDIIQRILEGGYGTEIPNRKVDEERQEISFTQEQGVAGELKAELLLSIGKAAFASWFIKDVVWKMEHKRLLILTKTRFYADYISTNFEAILEAACAKKGLQLQGIKVEG